jgi:hypothetical protein
MKYSTNLAQLILNAIAGGLNGGFIYYFAGSVPGSADDALNMVSDHTQVARISIAGGATGITFDAATGNTIAKAAAEAWSGLIDFDGTTAGPGTITPTFFRYCNAGDNGRVAAGVGDIRLQGTIGGPSSGANIRLSDGTTMTDNGTNTRGLPIYTLQLPENN